MELGSHGVRWCEFLVGMSSRTIHLWNNPGFKLQLGGHLEWWSMRRWIPSMQTGMPKTIRTLFHKLPSKQTLLWCHEPKLMWRRWKMHLYMSSWGRIVLVLGSMRDAKKRRWQRRGGGLLRGDERRGLRRRQKLLLSLWVEAIHLLLGLRQMG